MADRFKDTDYAWAAGFLDGEGCFTLARNSKKPGSNPTHRGIVVTATQRRIGPLLCLQEMFGGRIGRYNTREDYEMHQWGISSAKLARPMIPMVLPYLVVKRDEASIVLRFAERLTMRGKRFIPAEEMAIRQAIIDELSAIRGKEM
jgi:hypothetical protein